MMPVAENCAVWPAVSDWLAGVIWIVPTSVLLPHPASRRPAPKLAHIQKRFTLPPQAGRRRLSPPVPDFRCPVRGLQLDCHSEFLNLRELLAVFAYCAGTHVVGRLRRDDACVFPYAG